MTVGKLIEHLKTLDPYKDIKYATWTLKSSEDDVDFLDYDGESDVSRLEVGEDVVIW